MASTKKLSHRKTRRTIDQDALALAAWPWLGVLGAVIDHVVPPAQTGRPRAFNGASLLLLVALRWRAKALDHAEGYLANNWETVRLHGLEHGVWLHEQPPRWEHLRLVREHEGFAELLAALDGPFIDAALGTADAMGLLPERNSGTIIPHRSSHLQGDGTSATRMSKVFVDDEGRVRGSRATKLAPRIAEQLVTTKKGALLSGYPVIAWTVHGSDRWERVVMAIAPHPEGDEITVAENALHRILDRTDRVATIGYDRLMMGATQQRIMGRGVLPIVEHGQASSNVDDPRKCIVLPEDLVPIRGSKEPKQRRKGKGRRRRSGDAPTEKRRLAVAQLPDATHGGPDGLCHHSIAAIDTCLVVHDGGTDPEWWHRTEVPPVARVERVANGDGTYSLFGVWKLRCEHMDPANRYFEHRIELSGSIGAAATANRVNGYPYLHPQTSGLYGWRNDIESFFSWLKGRMPFYGQSTSLRYLDFVFDVIGAGVLSNAIAYDIHGSRR